MPYKNFLGYEKGEDGRPAVVEEEAAIVRAIYRLFPERKTQAAIYKYLESTGVTSPGGRSPSGSHEKWSKTTFTSILTNEKYKGNKRKRFPVTCSASEEIHHKFS
jgi:hypothetical protein